MVVYMGEVLVGTGDFSLHDEIYEVYPENN